MRWIITLCVVLWPTLAGFAQGLVDFRNDFLDGRVFILGDYTVTLPYPWRAQLYAGPDGTHPGALTPVGAPAPFGLGDRAGYWDPSPDAIRVVPGVAPGDYATVVVVAWFPGPGCDTFECTEAGAGPLQFTFPLRLQLGGNGLPPATLAGMYWVPEPAPTDLGLLALGFWGGLAWWRRRRAA